ncbi:DUF5719 family protein [Granulicoccus sp. GXG6511]|uniref:DUF5719 family protein n=1 Tax=Granulicoccus sp. GXG6511 TaxID=3381351 RepID=UPI003D7DC657
MTSPVVRLAVVGGLCLAIAGATLGGAALPVSEPRPLPPVDPDGRTVTVCPAAPTVNLVSTTTWGALNTRPITEERASPVPAGRGLTLTDQSNPVVMIAEGRQNEGAAAAVFARHAEGPERGLSMARCGTPATTTWFTGLVSDPDGGTAGRTEVLLINADAGSAEADLILFGPDGLQVAPGARGIAVPARSARTVALDTLFTRAEPVGLQVRTTRGRVAAVVQQRTSAGAQPAGTDWQVGSAPPAPEQVVAGIPAGPGPRTLILTNPSSRRTTATVEVLGPDGTFAPVDASTVDVNAEATAAVPLHPALNGEPGAVRIRAEQPLTAAVVSRSGDDPLADIAVQPSSPALSATSIGGVAVAQGVRGTLLVTNPGEQEITVPARVVGTDGAELGATEVRVPPGSTAPWIIDGIDRPAAVLVRAPAGGSAYAGLVLTSGEAPAGGLATSPLSVPAQEQGGGIEPVFDPGAGR